LVRPAASVEEGSNRKFAAMCMNVRFDVVVPRCA